MRPRIHAAARRRDRRQILVGACSTVQVTTSSVSSRPNVGAVRDRARAVIMSPVPDRDHVCGAAREVRKMKTTPNVPNKGARRGAKCASAGHEGGASLGFQPVHTPVLDQGGCLALYRLTCRVDHTAGVDRIRYG